MDRCPSCKMWLTSCPCCNVSFCPDCRATEDDLESLEEGEDE